MIVIALVACGGPGKRPTSVGGGYVHNALFAGGCGSDCDDNNLEIHGGYGGQLEVVVPREKVTMRVSAAAARHEIDPEFAAPRHATYLGGKLDWLWSTSEGPTGVAFNGGVGFGLAAMSSSTGPDLHGVLELEYRADDWSFVGSASPEVVLFLGDGLSSDMTGLFGLPVFVGVRRAIE
jgi:hypothetical protein